MRRVVVTGLGLVTPIGNTVSQSWKNLISHECGVEELNKSVSLCKVAAHVKTPQDHEFINNPRTSKRLPRFMQFACAAAHEALRDANWLEPDPAQKQRTGVCMGTGIGSPEEISNAYQKLIDSTPRKVSPYFIPRLLFNLSAGHIAINHGFTGPNHTPATACASGSHAIGDASRFIAFGDADVMVAGASEACISSLSFIGFSQLKALSTSFSSNPKASSRPFDKDRDGFVMGEGAGCLVLEEYEHAKKRNAKIYAELVGYGLSCDAHHITTPPSDGQGAYSAMTAALRNANIDPKEIDYINAHATSTPLGDLAESRAIHRVFHNDSYAPIAVSSTKGAIGHLLGAAGAVEAVYTVLAIDNDIIPPTLNLENKDKDLPDLDYVQSSRNVKDSIRRSGSGTGIYAALSNSFGFGGTNASLCFKKLT